MKVHKTEGAQNPSLGGAKPDDQDSGLALRGADESGADGYRAKERQDLGGGSAACLS
jgi:hypothetical protein